MLNVIGTIFGTSGYDNHTRELANSLNKLIDCTLTCPSIPNWERFVNDDELEMLKRIPDDEINLIITTPVNWKIYCTAKRNWAYLVWEGDSIPKSWIEEIENPEIEYIFVPSKHTMDAVPETHREKIRIVPHGVDLKKFYPKEKETKPFTFLANKGFRHMQDRGGIQYAIQAYLEEFTKEENVELILKINPAYGFDPNILNNFKGEAPVRIITDNIEYKNLVNIYNQCDVFVAPTRAEAFNIPCLEAMACGKPVITTDFGGQTDYCNNKNGWIVSGELEEVKFDLMYEGIKWLTPSILEIRKAMREAYEGKQKESINIAKYTWDNTAEIIHRFI